jgi:tetratricopeptide (TPR) repeat protein
MSLQQVRSVLALSAVLAAVLALAWWAYHPGLSGDFLFDDFVNLPAIGATGPVDHWSTFFRYITSGTADPTGRPMTLLTFLIDSRAWPSSPYPFKLTNLILHLINGALLAWVLWCLGRVLAFLPPSTGRGIEGDALFNHGVRNDTLPTLSGDPFPAERDEKNALWPALAALFGAGAWLLHPLLVSTTLYIVQREAMLPATFVLIAILGWMGSREALARGRVKRALAGMAASAWLCTILAVLSKANGALLPLLLLLVEWIVLAPRRPMMDAFTHRWYRRAVVVFLIAPGALVIAYLLYLLPGSLSAPIDARGWSTAQRLLTDPRVLMDYLRLLFVPQAHSSGLFNDAFPISTDWLHPASTVPCIVLVVALIGAGFALRKKHPAIALVLLFYFTAQLMESGWIPLELYYEHRNYLPAMLLFWPIGIGLTRPGLLRGVRIACAAGIVLALAVLTFQRATLWGDGLRQARVWAAINPDSARAQANAALYDLAHDSPRLAAARLRLSMPKHPDDIQAPINLIGAECKLGRVRSQTLTAAEAALARTRLGGQAAFNWFNEALVMASNHTCAGLDFAALQATLDAARRNPHWRNRPGLQQDLDHLQGQLDLAEGNPKQALASFNRALAAAPKPGSALQQAAYLGSRGYSRLGLAHLDYFATLPPGPKPGIGMPRIHAWVLREQGWWEKETAHLRETLEQDAKAKVNADSSGA